MHRPVRGQCVRSHRRRKSHTNWAGWQRRKHRYRRVESDDGLPGELVRFAACSSTLTALIQLKERGGPCYRPSGKYSVSGASSSRLNPKCK